MAAVCYEAMKLCCALLALSVPAAAQETALLSEIEKIRVIDNHGHPLSVVTPNEKPDDEYDALTFEDMEAFPMPVRIRPDNPEYIQAWRLLYGYREQEINDTNLRSLMARKRAAMQLHGDKYPAWVLDKLGVETLLANRVAMGRGLNAPRFRWVSMIDALIFPLSNEAARKENPDYRSFYVGEERLLKRYLVDAGVNEMPATLDQYLNRVVTPTLERQKKNGALGVKFEAAYLRKLDIDDPPRLEAERVYAAWAKGGTPPTSEYKKLQDFLFREISREAGRLGMAVHIHLCAGAGAYYKVAGTSPLLLDSVLNDPTLRKTNFVLIHGGWPFTREVGVYLLKPNVYTDISAITFVLYPRQLAGVLREWLELIPEKVLYGGDVEPFTPEINWEETGWLTVTTARRALAIALTGMIRDGEITRARALEIARLVLRNNARKLYKLP
jgi:predicted TIM-barrel fold metal-dependent hydrolase